MASVIVTKRPGRRHYYARIDGLYVSTGHTDQRLAMEAAVRIRAVGVDAFRNGKRALSEKLADLVEDHLSHLRDHEGRSAEHVRKKRAHLMHAVEVGRIRSLRDVHKRSVESWLDTLTCGQKTRNEYLTAWNVFLDWLVYEGRLDQNPIRGRVRRLRARPDLRNMRRALTLIELRDLVAASGPRELLYLAAATTGARFNELKQLLWSDDCETAPQPHIVMRPETTKNRNGRTQYLTAELASALADARARGSSPSVFLGMPSHHTVNKDLATAGIAKRTDEGIACFHSLRHTFTTIIARQTKDPRLAQRMADHADIQDHAGLLAHGTRRTRRGHARVPRVTGSAARNVARNGHGPGGSFGV